MRPFGSLRHWLFIRSAQGLRGTLWAHAIEREFVSVYCKPLGYPSRQCFAGRGNIEYDFA